MTISQLTILPPALACARPRHRPGGVRHRDRRHRIGGIGRIRRPDGGEDVLRPTPITPRPAAPEVPVDSTGTSIGSITDVQRDGASVTLTAEHGAVRVTFLEDGTFRLEADPSGSFTDPANTPQGDAARTADIVVGAKTFGGAAVAVADGDVIRIASKAVTVSVDRATGAVSATRADGSTIFAESAAITFGKSSATQHLKGQKGEQILGGKCSSFTASVGLEKDFAGNVIFTVDTDGTNRYQSRTFTPGFAPEEVNVDLTGVQYIDLDVTAPGSINGAHGVWGDALFHC